MVTFKNFADARCSRRKQVNSEDDDVPSPTWLKLARTVRKRMKQKRIYAHLGHFLKEAKKPGMLCPAKDDDFTNVADAGPHGKRMCAHLGSFLKDAKNAELSA